MIKVNNLSKEFHGQGTNNELLAVDHVDFTIQNSPPDAAGRRR